MLTFTPAESFEVLRDSVLIPPHQSSLGDKRIVVVSVFGSSHLTGRSGYKRAFRLAIDSFGSVNLFQKPEDKSKKKNARESLYSKSMKLRNIQSASVSSPTTTEPDDLRFHLQQSLTPDEDEEDVGGQGYSASTRDDEGYRGHGVNVGSSLGANASLKHSDMEKAVETEGPQKRHQSSSSAGDRKSWGDISSFGDGDECTRTGDTTDKIDEMFSLDGFYNASEGVLFLHLEGAYDPKLFANAKDELLKDLSKKGFVPAWVDIKSNYCKYLLLMFSLSHVMILSDVGSSFDTSYLHLFRVLETIRHKLKPNVVKKLEAVGGLPKDWVIHGRLCSPRLICVYEVEEVEIPKTPQSVLKPPMNNMKNVLEDEIYNILRKCRIITNISANSLCAVPMSDEYVFLYEKSTQNAPSQDEPESTLFQEVVLESYFNAKHQLHKPKRAHRSASGSNMRHLCRPDVDTTTYSEMLMKFKQFVLRHTELAHKTGFDDDSRKVAGFRRFFVLPTFHQWTTAFSALSDVLLGNLNKHQKPIHFLKTAQ